MVNEYFDEIVAVVGTYFALKLYLFLCCMANAGSPATYSIVARMNTSPHDVQQRQKCIDVLVSLLPLEISTLFHCCTIVCGT
jgi:hypothetical protein